MILKLFSTQPEHPLGDANELKRVLLELSTARPAKAIEEVTGWLESLRDAADFRVDHLFEVVCRLDEAVFQALRQLNRDYLHSARMSKSEERRAWSLGFNYWGDLASVYDLCLDRVRRDPKDKGCVALKPLVPLAFNRLLGARAYQLKWAEYRYGPIGEDLWRGLGRVYLEAEGAGVASVPVQLYPAHPGHTSVNQQYLQAMVFYASSMDTLMPLEIAVADRLIAHFLPDFVFSRECRVDSQYWVDPASGLPPVRLARHPQRCSADLRFFSPGAAVHALAALTGVVERGEIPDDLNLGGEYPPKVLLPVLRHLGAYWAAETPVRVHPRHAVKTRIAVLHGFDDCFTVFAGGVARLGKERVAESWVVENVSLGGFGTRVVALGDWLRIGALMAIQAEGGDNWVLGVVRRVNKDSENEACVGVETLSRTPVSGELRSRLVGLAVQGALPAIRLDAGQDGGGVRLVLPVGGFDLRATPELLEDGRRWALVPVDLEESGSDFEIGRFRRAEA